MKKVILPVSLIAACLGVLTLVGQAPQNQAQNQSQNQNPDPGADPRPQRFGPPLEGERPPFNGPPPFRPGAGPGGGRGPGGPGLAQELALVKKFDLDGDGRLNAPERKAAREFVLKERAEGRGGRGPGGPGGFGGFRGPARGGPGGRGEAQTPAQPGLKVSPADIQTVATTPLYDPNTLRTLFLDFESADWEKELVDFKNTDVEVPVKLIVDGRTFPDVGVHFRGMSSFGVGEGRKRSLNLSLDYAHEDQRLGGYRTLNLLNSHEDPTFLRSVLYSQIAREFIPAARANLVRVVINGESWGLYVNVQQFNKDFVKEWFGTTKGARWKVQGSPRGQGTLAYLGADAAAYKGIYHIKSKDDPKAWADLIELCRVLNETPAEKLEEALSPMLDIDGALKFLALENVLINNDGYWIRTSDYNIYQDGKGRFHIIPHDTNETFGMPGGPGFGGGPGGPGGRGGAPRISGVELDPLTGANDASKPLLSKLLAAPALRNRYLGYVREIASKSLDWQKLEPVIAQYQALIAGEVEADTRKLDSTAAFGSGIPGTSASEAGPGRRSISLKKFAEDRRGYLLNHPAVKSLP